MPSSSSSSSSQSSVSSSNSDSIFSYTSSDTSHTMSTKHTGGTSKTSRSSKNNNKNDGMGYKTRAEKLSAVMTDAGKVFERNREQPSDLNDAINNANTFVVDIDGRRRIWLTKMIVVVIINMMYAIELRVNSHIYKCVEFMFPTDVDEKTNEALMSDIVTVDRLPLELGGIADIVKDVKTIDVICTTVAIMVLAYPTKLYRPTLRNVMKRFVIFAILASLLYAMSIMIFKFLYSNTLEVCTEGNGIDTDSSVCLQECVFDDPQPPSKDGISDKIESCLADCDVDYPPKDDISGPNIYKMTSMLGNPSYSVIAIVMLAFIEGFAPSTYINGAVQNQCIQTLKDAKRAFTAVTLLRFLTLAACALIRGVFLGAYMDMPGGGIFGMSLPPMICVVGACGLALTNYNKLKRPIGEGTAEERQQALEQIMRETNAADANEIIRKYQGSLQEREERIKEMLNEVREERRMNNDMVDKYGEAVYEMARENESMVGPADPALSGAYGPDDEGYNDYGTGNNSYGRGNNRTVYDNRGYPEDDGGFEDIDEPIAQPINTRMSRKPRVDHNQRRTQVPNNIRTPSRSHDTEAAQTTVALTPELMQMLEHYRNSTQGQSHPPQSTPKRSSGVSGQGTMASNRSSQVNNNQYVQSPAQMSLVQSRQQRSTMQCTAQSPRPSSQQQRLHNNGRQSRSSTQPTTGRSSIDSSVITTNDFNQQQRCTIEFDTMEDDVQEDSADDAQSEQLSI